MKCKLKKKDMVIRIVVGVTSVTRKIELEL